MTTFKQLAKIRTVLHYPYHLKESEVVSLLSAAPKINFGEEGCPSKDYLDIFINANLFRKCLLRKYHLQNRKVGNRQAYFKLRFFLMKVSRATNLMTDDIKEVIAGSEFLMKFTKRKLMILSAATQTILTPAGDGQQAVILKPEDDNVSNLVKEESIKADILENILDKMQAVLTAMSAGKISRGSLGTLSKSFENLMKSYTMFKGETSAKSFLQVNIGNLTLQQKKELSLKAGEQATSLKAPADFKK